MINLPGLSALRIPAQKKEKSWFDLRPKQIAAWIETLPLGDTEQTSKQLFTVLTHTNRISIAAPVRLKMLEQLQPSLQFALNALKKNYLGQSFPLNNRALKYVDRSFAMYNEIAIAYKIATVDLLKHSRFYQKKALCSAFYRALETYGKLLVSYYQIYAPEPSSLWTEIHALYSLAEQNELHDTKVHDISIDAAGPQTVVQKYKQVLLLSLSNPYHLGKDDIVEVETQLQQWSDLSLLINPEIDDQGEAHFACCLTCDRPPMELHLIKTLQNEAYRFIDTTELTQQLRELLTSAQNNFSSNKISSKSTSRQSTLLRLLIHAWDSRDKRRFSRSRSQEGIDVSVGLNSTHYIIEEMAKPPIVVEDEQPQAEEAAFIDDTRNPLEISHTTFSIEPVQSPDEAGNLWDHHGQLKARSNNKTKAAVKDKTLPSPSYQHHPWKALNAGAGGYCLLWDHDKSSNAQIGEIVGIRETITEDKNEWRIGVVRWMQYVRNQGLKLGIQILAPNAVTLQSSLIKGNAKKQEYSCLSLPEIKAIKQPASILTPSLHFRVGDALILNDHGKMSSVQLTRLIETTGNYSRFQYAPLNSNENQTLDTDLGELSNGWHLDED